MEKVQEIKKLTTQIALVRAEMSKNADQLKEYKRFRSFLNQLTPEAYRPKQENNNQRKDFDYFDDENFDQLLEEVETSDETDMYFKTPQQLLNIFGELEENNLTLIQTCQETEETLEQLKRNIQETEDKM